MCLFEPSDSKILFNLWSKVMALKLSVSLSTDRSTDRV
ncbi:hypothetical protein LEP1GSC088_2398 [Leptospira interrogans str. L1207]|nr:hypothetical protein LEP1GSC088_2398 [Leptospira interrogans str. L1207]